MLLGRFSALYFVAALLALAATASSVKAEFTITVTEDATGVTTSGSGSLDTTDLTLTPYGGGIGSIFFPSVPVIGVGTDSPTALEYTGLTTTISPFGAPFFPSDTSDSGDAVGINGGGGGAIYVPVGYTSGSALSGTAFYAGETLADFGLTVGETFTPTWGTGPDADSFVITTVVPPPAPAPASSVPLPASVWTGALGAIMLGGCARWKKLKDRSSSAAI